MREANAWYEERKRGMQPNGKRLAPRASPAARGRTSERQGNLQMLCAIGQKRRRAEALAHNAFLRLLPSWL